MTTFAEVRAKYPQYNDLSDQQLAEGLHQKFYSDMPFDEFASKVGYSAAPAEPTEEIPTIGGAGGYNPFAGRLLGAAEVTANKLGTTTEALGGRGNEFGPIEPLLQMGSGGAGAVAGGLAGLLQGGWNTLAPENMQGPQAGDRVRQVQEALTYQPRTGVGQAMSRVAGAPFELYGAGTNKAGEFITDKTGSPLAGTIVKTAGDAAPAFIGRRGAVPEPRRTGTYESTKFDVLTSEQLAKAADDAYKASDAAGVVIRPESTQRVVTMIDGVATSENLGKLPPKLKEARDILSERIEKGEALSLRDADKVRQIINDAKKSTDAADQRLASIIQEQYDTYLDNLGAADTLAGNTAQGVALLKEARDLFRRRRNSEMLDQMEDIAKTRGEAKYTQAGDEHALRSEFSKLATNPRQLRKFSPEEQAAIKRVARPGAGANALRNLGKFDPMRGGMATALGGGVGAGLGALAAGTGGAIIGPLALGGAAHLANRLSLGVTKRNAANARAALVGRGADIPNRPLNTQRQPVSGEVMPREPLALPAPNIISGSRSAPGTTYAREQMGLTPDVEAAGLLHPGMARENVHRPLALPHLPAEPPAVSPMVVDPRGRVAPSAAALDEYLQAYGLKGAGNAKQPQVGILGEAKASVKARRSSKEIQDDIRRLSTQARTDLAKEPAGSPKMRKFFEKLADLQNELAASQAGQ